MAQHPILKTKREIIWLTVHYSTSTRGWFIETTFPGFITPAIAKSFTEIAGKNIVYMVRGFDDYSHAKSFAIDYHQAKSHGAISRLRLD